MTGKGRCLDNIYIERFWRSLKHEEIYLNDCDTVEELENAIASYIVFYNTERPHQSLRYKTPAEVYLPRHDPPVAVSEDLLLAAQLSDNFCLQTQRE